MTPKELYKSATDNEIIVLIAKGDYLAFEELYDRYFDKIMIYGLKISSKKELIKDSIQDLFLDFWKNRLQLRPLNVKAYIYRAFRNKLLKRIDQNDKLTVVPLTEEISLSQIPDYLSRHEDLIKTTLEDLTESLTTNQREAIYLKYRDNLSNSEIAQVLNVNYQSTSNLIHRALKRIRIKISQKLKFHNKSNTG